MVCGHVANQTASLGMDDLDKALGLKFKHTAIGYFTLKIKHT